MQYNMGRSGLSDVVFLPHFHLVHIRVLSLSSCPIHPAPFIHPSIHPSHSVHCTSDCTLYHPVSFSSSWPCENSDKQVGQVGYRIPKVGTLLSSTSNNSLVGPPRRSMGLLNSLLVIIRIRSRSQIDCLEHKKKTTPGIKSA